MKGKVQFVKFPVGIYHCLIVDVRAGISSHGKDLIVVTYRVLEGPKEGQTFKERLTSVSSKFLEGIGEPHGYNDVWDTENWRNKEVFVDVKYSPDEHEWSRYGHHQNNPEEKLEIQVEGRVEGNPPPEEEIPF